jgi:outer membrane protein assembly factor BamA
MNRTFRSTARVGAVDRFNASWETPWLGERRQTLHISGDVELPRPEVDELRTNRVEVATTQFLGDYLRARMGLTFVGRLEFLRRDGTHPNGGVDQLSPVVGVGWSRDKRNVRVDPRRGTFASSFGEMVSGWTDDDLSYGRLHLDGRGFFPLGSHFVAASRLGAILTTGRVPDYRRLGIGGPSSIRGQPSDVEQGTNLVRGSVELRFPLLPRQRFALPIPLLPRRISNVDLRIDGELFLDTAAAWDRSPELGSARFRNGMGVGLRIFVPILELVRLEVGFDDAGKATFYLREGNII